MGFPMQGRFRQLNLAQRRHAKPQVERSHGHVPKTDHARSMCASAQLSVCAHVSCVLRPSDTHASTGHHPLPRPPQFNLLPFKDHSVVLSLVLLPCDGCLIVILGVSLRNLVELAVSSGLLDACAASCSSGELTPAESFRFLAG